MLTITEEAATLIGALAAQASLPHEGGLRIGVDAEHHSLSMRLAPSPDDTETVIASHGARVFMPPRVARQLDTRVLKAEIADRSLFFLDD